MQHSNTAGCILLKFYIKPQHTANVYNLLYVVSYRNSTSNHNFFSQCYGNLEVVSYRNSTSNHNTLRRFLPAIRVVSYRNSTSNHNGSVDVLPGRPVVSYRNSTSNHNVWLAKATHKRLYLIEILHQTTTRQPQVSTVLSLYLIEILHQTTTDTFAPLSVACCILSKFYIKPQLKLPAIHNAGVVSYRNSTSNHNSLQVRWTTTAVVSYRNSTSNHNW